MKPIARDCTMPDADLMIFASNLASTITCELAEFAPFGVDAAAIMASETLGNSFEVFPPDDVIVAYVIS